MGPKKAKGQTMSLAEFNVDKATGSSWADDMDDLPSVPAAYTSSQPSYGDRRGYSSQTVNDNSYTRSGATEGEGRQWTVREEVPLPNKPPYTAHVGNLSFDATEAEIGDFFAKGQCSVKSIRLMRDKELDRPRGFGYVEFNDLNSLKNALPLSGQSLAGRDVRITVAEAPKTGYSEREPERELDWGSARSGRSQPPPPMEQGRRGYEITGGYESRGAGQERGGYGEREGRESRPPREPERELDWGSVRRGPPQPIEPKDGGYQSRRQYGDRQNSTYEKRNGGLERKEGGYERPQRSDRLSGEAPQERRKLALAPRTAGDGAPLSPTSTSSTTSRSNPFGAARAVDTAAAERRAEEKFQQQQKERDAALAARSEKTIEKKTSRPSETKADKPLEILRRTSELTVEDKATSEPSEDAVVEKKAAAEERIIAKEQVTEEAELPVADGWATVRKTR